MSDNDSSPKYLIEEIECSSRYWTCFFCNRTIQPKELCTRISYSEQSPQFNNYFLFKINIVCSDICAGLFILSRRSQ